MNSQTQTRLYMLVVTVLGLVCVSFAAYQFPLEKVNVQLIFLSLVTVGFGSRVTVQIPRFKSHIAVSDTFIFLALLIYGGEIAVLLAAIEAFCSAWRFCNKKVTVFFNAAVMAVSTMLIAQFLRMMYAAPEMLHNAPVSDLMSALLSIALIQYLANSGLASIYGALKSEKPWWETWKTHYLWTSITYLVGAVSAGILVKLIVNIGFVVVFAAVPVMLILYFTYRMYLKNVEISILQADQAKQYAAIVEEQSLALAESEERFRSAFTYAPIGIALVSPDGNWLKVNRALSEILGYAEGEFLARDFQSMIHEEDLGETLVILHQLFSGKAPALQAEQRYLHKSGKTVWVWWSVSTTSEAKAERPNLIFQIQDITDKKIAEEQLHYKATHDALTGLPNRAFFMSRLEQALERAQDDSYYKVSVLFIDLDRFKIVNDSLGHQIGDELLIGIAARLKDCLRPSDLIARLGGDEFTILVQGKYEIREVVRIAERINEKFSLPFDLSGHEIFSSASIGILQAAENHTTPEAMMRDADIAMYQAKRAGKARHEVFDREMHEQVKETLQLETDLRHAVEKQSFKVFYQPIYSLLNGELEGFEALARWEHETLGTIPPCKFVPLAEEIGLIDQLGEQILRRACEQGRILRANLPADAPFSLCVNLSVKQFARKDLVKNIEKILTETNFSPAHLKLEITESVFLEHKENAVEMLHQLRALGIEINIDDFGTGYSNLNYLMRLPISTLKIDRSFVSPINADGQNIEIVKTILMLARNLGMRVIAEGVETNAQCEQLKKLGCEAAQGYYFAEPRGFEDCLNALRGAYEPRVLPAFEDVPIVSVVQ